MSNLELETADIETIKDLLKRCRIITTTIIVRDIFCKSIGIEVDNISPDSVDTLNDNLFIDALLDYLQRTDNKSAFYKLCVKIEPHFRNSIELGYQLQKIKRKLCLLELVTILKINDFVNLFDQYNSAYRQCLLRKQNKINFSGSLDKDLKKSIEILKNLDNYKDDLDNNFSLLDYFVGYLTLNIEKSNSNFSEKLREWSNNYQKNLDNLIIIIKDKQISEKIYAESCLLITMDKGNNNSAIIKAWVMEDTGKFKFINSHFEQELTWHNLEEEFYKVLDIFLDSIDNMVEIKNIQLFLPYKYVMPVDTFLIERENEKYYLGAYYQINIRLLERIRPTISRQEKDIKERWIKKCKALKEKIDKCEFSNTFIALEILQKSRKILLNEFRENELAAKLTCAIEHSKTEEVMDILYFTGIPLALWVRQNINNAQLTKVNVNHYQTELDNIICQASCYQTLSKSVKEKRREADEQRETGNNDHIGNYLSLLWDDADLVPLGDEHNHQLSMP